jgi:hypothetical protein
MGSTEGIAAGYGLDDVGIGVRVLTGAKIFSFPLCPDRFWNPHNHIYNGYRGFLLMG